MQRNHISVAILAQCEALVVSSHIQRFAWCVVVKAGSMFRGIYMAAVPQPAPPAPPPPAAVVPPPVRPPRAPRAAIRPGIPRWLARSSCVAFGRARQLRAVSDARVQTLASTINPPAAVFASKALSPAPLISDPTNTYVVGGEVVEIHRRGHDDHHKTADCNLGVASHIISQVPRTRRPLG